MFGKHISYVVRGSFYNKMRLQVRTDYWRAWLPNIHKRMDRRTLDKVIYPQKSLWYLSTTYPLSFVTHTHCTLTMLFYPKSCIKFFYMAYSILSECLAWSSKPRQFILLLLCSLASSKSQHHAAEVEPERSEIIKEEIPFRQKQENDNFNIITWKKFVIKALVNTASYVFVKFWHWDITWNHQKQNQIHFTRFNLELLRFDRPLVDSNILSIIFSVASIIGVNCVYCPPIGDLPRCYWK